MTCLVTSQESSNIQCQPLKQQLHSWNPCLSPKRGEEQTLLWEHSTGPLVVTMQNDLRVPPGNATCMVSKQRCPPQWLCALHLCGTAVSPPSVSLPVLHLLILCVQNCGVFVHVQCCCRHWISTSGELSDLGGWWKNERPMQCVSKLLNESKHWVLWQHINSTSQLLLEVKGIYPRRRNFSANNQKYEWEKAR